MPSSRLCFSAIAAFCLAAMVAALIMQYQFDMEPCPLCISQRIMMILVGVSALIGVFVSRSTLGRRLSAGIAACFALIGAGIAGRHVWIQNLPEDEVPLCGPGLAYTFETRPLFDALSVLFAGDGHCADVHFHFLGLSIPGWTLVSFIALAIALLWLLFRPTPTAAVATD